MTHTEHYLDLLRQRLDLPSDYAVAKALNVSRQCVSGWRTGRTSFDEVTARRIAKLLDIEPGVLLVAMLADRTRDEESRRAFEWVFERLERLGELVGLFAVVVSALLFVGSPSPAEAHQTLRPAASVYYVKSRLTRWVNRLTRFFLTVMLPLQSCGRMPILKFSGVPAGHSSNHPAGGTSAGTQG